MIEYSRLPTSEHTPLKSHIESLLELTGACGLVWGRDISEHDLLPLQIEELRVLGPESVWTCDWVSDRLNIMLDEDDVIATWNWG